MIDSENARRRFLRDGSLGLAALGAAATLGPLRAAKAQAQAAVDAPPVSDYPQLEFVYTAIVSIAATETVGDTLAGTQRIIPITGGSFKGPRIRGIVLPGAADWNLRRNDGTTVVAASYFMRTDDGIIVKIVNQGVNSSAAAPGSQRPHFTIPSFEAPKGRYEWLNQSVFVGTLTAGDPGTVRIRVFKVI